MKTKYLFSIVIILFFIIHTPLLLDTSGYDDLDPNSNDIFNEDAYLNYEEYIYGKMNLNEISKRDMVEMNFRWEKYIIKEEFKQL